MVKILTKIEFFVVSQKGSHIKMKRKTSAGTEIVIVPNHKELTPGTFRNILKMAKLSLYEFDRLN